MPKLTRYQINAITEECSTRVLEKKQREFDARFKSELAKKKKLVEKKAQIEQEIAEINKQITQEYGDGYTHWSDTVYVPRMPTELAKLERELIMKQIDGGSCEDVINRFVAKFE